MRTLLTTLLLLFTYCINAQVSVSIQPQNSPPQPCAPIVFNVIITNNGSSAITPTVQIDFEDAAVASFTAPDPLICTTPTPTMELSYFGSVEMTNNNAIAASGGTASYTFTVTMACASIPDGGSGNIPFTATVTNAGSSVTVNTAANGNSGNATWQLVFPYMTYSTGQTLTSVQYSNSTFHTVAYTNTGLATFDGCVQLNIANTCDFSVASIDVYRNSVWGVPPATFIGGPTTSFCLSSFPGLVLAQNDKLIFRVRFIYAGTTCASPTCAGIDFDLDWGCGGDICKTNMPATERSITAASAPTPNVIVARVTPASHGNSGALANDNNFVWDNTCTSSIPGTNGLTWEFLVRNDGTMPAGNVTVTIDKNIIGSNTFIDGNSFFFNYHNGNANTALSNRANSFGITSINTGATAVVTPFTAGELTNVVVSDCYQTAGVNFDVRTITITIPVLAVGERFLFRFNTYRCCSPTVNFNTGFFFNRWTLVSTYQNCVGDVVYSDVFNTTDLGGTAPVLHRAVAIPNTTPGALVGGPLVNFLSTHPSDNGFDLALTQQAVGNNPNLLGGHDACGEPDVYTVTNLTFTSNTNIGVAGFDQQIFSNTAMDGPLTDWIGGTPRGIFRVEFVPSGSLSIVGTPSIRKGSVIWPATVTVLTGGRVRCDFDISLLTQTEPGTGNQIRANGDAFRNFFIGSRITFEMRACCPLVGDANQTCAVETSFNPRPNTGCATNPCFLNLSRVIVPVNVRCPGCETPGAIVSSCELVRSTLGFQDINGWGTADYNASMPGGLNPITPVYPPLVNGQLNLGASIVDDELTSTANVTFYPGGDDPGSTPVGYTYADVVTAFGQELQCLYLEQQVTGPVDMPNGGIRAISGTGEFTFRPNGSMITYTYPIPAGQEIFTEVDGQTTRTLVNVCLQELNQHLHSTSQLNPLVNLEFNPGDRYTFTLRYRVVENPNGTPYSAKEIRVWNWAYHTMQALSNTFTAPFQSGGTQHISTVGEINASPPYGPVNPSTLALYYCEGLLTNHNIHPVVYEYTSQYIDEGLSESCAQDTVQELRTDECHKLLHVNVRHFIWHTQPDLFPYEYRIIPGTTPANLNLGLPLVEAPTTTFPHGNFHVRLTLPLGFVPPAVLAGNTKSYTMSRTYRDQVNIRRIQTNANTDLVFIPHTPIANTWDMMVNYSTATYQALFTPGGGGQARVMMGNPQGINMPAAGNIELLPVLKNCAVVQTCTTSNVLTANQPRNLLAVGDEVFEHDFKVRLQSRCSDLNTVEETEYTVEEVLVRTPVWSNTTDAMDDINTSLGGGTFTKPYRDFTFTSAGAVTLCGNVASMPVTLTASAATSNLIIYVQNPFVNNIGQALPGVTLNALLRGTGTTATLLTPDAMLSTTTRIAYRVTNLNAGANAFTIRLVASSCANLYNANGSLPVVIKMGYSLSCEAATTLFENSCTKGYSEFLMPLPPVLYTASHSINGPSNATCGGSTILYATFTGTGAGGIYDYKVRIDMPTNAELQTITWRPATGGWFSAPIPTSGTGVVYSATPLSPGYTRYVVDFTNQVPLAAACTGTATRWTDGINNGEAVQVAIAYRIRCNNYMNPITIGLNGTQYCGDPIVEQVKVWPGYSVNTTNPCQRPTVSLAPYSESCIGTTDGFINTTVTNPTSTAPYSYLWSNASTGQNLQHVSAGTYTVTVTDANNCTATGTSTIAVDDEVLEYVYTDDPNSFSSQISDVMTDASGNIYIVGNHYGNLYLDETSHSYTGSAGYIAKYNNCGTLIWEHRDLTAVTSTNYVNFFIMPYSPDFDMDANGNIYTVINDNVSGEYRSWLEKRNSSGVIANPTTDVRDMYTNDVAGVSPKKCIAYDLAVDNANGFVYVTGTTKENGVDNLYYARYNTANLNSSPVFAPNSVATSSVISSVLYSGGTLYGGVLMGTDLYVGILDPVTCTPIDFSTPITPPVAPGLIAQKAKMAHDAASNHLYIIAQDNVYYYDATTLDYINSISVSEPVDIFSDANGIYVVAENNLHHFNHSGVSQWVVNFTTLSGEVNRTICPAPNGKLVIGGNLYRSSMAHPLTSVEQPGYTPAVSLTPNKSLSFFARFDRSTGVFKAESEEEVTELADAIIQPIDSGSNGLVVFPNPSENIFNLRAIGTDAQGEYMVMNAMGQKIAEGTLQQQAILDMSDQASGLYWITLRYNDPNLHDISRKLILRSK